MANTRRKSSETNDIPEIRPALTPEGRENQLIALATDLVERRLLDGSASSQETTFYLKLGSMKSRLEMEKLKEENKLLIAKTEALQSSKRQEELFEKAIRAMRSYSGAIGSREEDDEYDDY